MDLIIYNEYRRKRQLLSRHIYTSHYPVIYYPVISLSYSRQVDQYWLLIDTDSSLRREQK